MSSLCEEQHQHKYHHPHQLFYGKKALRDIDIPPRMLLGRRTNQPPISPENSDIFADSPRNLIAAEETLMQKYLPYNCGDDDDDSDPYSSDNFRMFEFKVRRCTRSRSHDWTDCPFAHPGEKARRRDPRRYHYSGTVCSEYRRGGCSRGENCEFAHGVFECWLHPARYRTEACKDGVKCKRKVCFFAHSPRQLRVLPLQCHNTSPEVSPVAADSKYRSSATAASSSSSAHCCLFCQHSVTSSPTSTLMGLSHLSPPMSPSLSPPLSPAKTRSVTGFSPISRYSDRFTSSDSSGSNQLNHGVLSYRDVLTELMSSLETINLNEASPTTTNRRNLSWVDVSFNGEDQPQFILSPSTPNASGSSRDFFSGDCSSKTFKIDDLLNDNGWACPDLGWVNDLLT